MTFDGILFQKLDQKLSQIVSETMGGHVGKSITFCGRNVFQNSETEAQLAISDQVLSTE